MRHYSVFIAYEYPDSRMKDHNWIGTVHCHNVVEHLLKYVLELGEIQYITHFCVTELSR